MKAALTQFVASALARVGSGVSMAAIEDAVRAPLPTGLNAEETWTLASFLRHERRQMWVGYIVESRLRGQGVEMAQRGWLGHPEGVPQKGDVPGEDGWAYYFHGRGCCFTHQDGTQIDVDFADDGTAVEIDSYFYDHFLASAASLGWCERQIKGQAGVEGGWRFDLAGLVAREFVQLEWRFHLTEKGRALAQAIEPLVEILDASEELNQCFALALLGDASAAWKTAERIGMHSHLMAEAASRQQEGRIAALKAALRGSDKDQAQSAMASLARFGKEHAFAEARQALTHRPVSELNHKALATLRQWPDYDVARCFVEAISQFTRRLLGAQAWAWLSSPGAGKDPDEEMSRASLIVGISRTLFEMLEPQKMTSETRSILLGALTRDQSASDGEAGMLLYLLDREAGRAKLAAALTSSIPIVRINAACCLALIGDESCIEALIRAASGPADRGGHEAASALVLIDDEKAQSEAAQWMRRNDGYEEPLGHEVEINGKKVRCVTVDESMRASLREFLNCDHEQLRKGYGPLLQRWPGID